MLSKERDRLWTALVEGYTSKAGIMLWTVARLAKAANVSLKFAQENLRWLSWYAQKAKKAHDLNFQLNTTLITDYGVRAISKNVELKTERDVHRCIAGRGQGSLGVALLILDPGAHSQLSEIFKSSVSRIASSGIGSLKKVHTQHRMAALGFEVDGYLTPPVEEIKDALEAINDEQKEMTNAIRELSAGLKKKNGKVH